MAELLFVYGTLKRDHPQSENDRLGDEAEIPMISALRDNPDGYLFGLIGFGQTEGKLFEMDSFPALKEAPGNLVAGEVYSVPENVLRQLDDYEGENYFRKKKIVTLDDGTHAEAWVYFVKS